MKHLKKFEDVDFDDIVSKAQDRERILSDVAIYLEDLLIEKDIEAFEECTYTDYEYDNKNVIYYEFSFISLNMGEEDDDKFDEFAKEHNLGEYKSKFIKYSGRGYYIFTITLFDDDIENLYKDSEIYNASQKYNL